MHTAHASAALLLLAAALAAPPAPAAAQETLDRLGWMAGCWERSAGDTVIEERWLPPRGGVMLGVSRTTRGGRAAGHEFLRIFERDGDIVLAALPSGQTLTEFSGVVVADSAAVFENPTHDFPQRVMYRPGPDSLWARIEGEAGGRARGIDFRMGRVPCR